MDTFTIMISKAKFFKNKIKLFLSKGFRIKVGKNSYILFKKEEDYVNLIYLESVFFDLIKNWFMLSVRISSYGCTREVWRAREKRKSCSRR